MIAAVTSFYFLSASFYGSSHAALPLADARSTTSISFRLRTSRPEALIVLAAGRMDYCLVMMQGGAIKVSGRARTNLLAAERRTISKQKQVMCNDSIYLKGSGKHFEKLFASI